MIGIDEFGWRSAERIAGRRKRACRTGRRKRPGRRESLERGQRRQAGQGQIGPDKRARPQQRNAQAENRDGGKLTGHADADLAKRADAGEPASAVSRSSIRRSSASKWARVGPVGSSGASTFESSVRRARSRRKFSRRRGSASGRPARRAPAPPVPRAEKSRQPRAPFPRSNRAKAATRTAPTPGRRQAARPCAERLVRAGRYRRAAAR